MTSNTNVQTGGRLINTGSGGLVQLANDGNYYEEILIIQDGVPTKILVNLGSPI